ncbi:hypothetical protein [Corynebacterium meitnerae]|uniref:Uncharacterized protein n=1 Tax=Corynebacterium meitnerae TaxID=2913498 RepID=A0A9X3LUC7_9CORY|nr:hypothetical protein [Corynebacterium meitnerae]MCZ9292948.1 hypothetical protein [Corynebacterium meitnerae]
MSTQEPHTSYGTSFAPTFGPSDTGTPSSNSSGKKRRGCSVGLGILLIIVAVLAVLMGRGMIPGPSGLTDRFSAGSDGDSKPAPAKGTKAIHGVVGSEKREYFEDPAVVERLAELGYTVTVSTAGSRRIATEVDLDNEDFVSPSSSPATQKVTDQGSGYTADYPFFSPMAVATFKPIVDLLMGAGVVRQEGESYILDMNKYIDITKEGKRWRDLGDSFPSPRNVQISTTDIRTSNSAAMFLSILAWQFGEREPDKADDVAWLTQQVSPYFTGQGYTQSSSAGPFNDYLSQGMGSTPMVLVYEAQFLGEQMKPNSRIKDDMVLVQLEPTMLANHGIVGISAEGKELGRLLSTDETLQRLAAQHGFRPASNDYLTEALADKGLPAPSSYVSSVDPPNYDRLEALIEGTGTRYGTVPPRNQEEQEK